MPLEPGKVGYLRSANEGWTLVNVLGHRKGEYHVQMKEGNRLGEALWVSDTDVVEPGKKGSPFVTTGPGAFQSGPTREAVEIAGRYSKKELERLAHEAGIVLYSSNTKNEIAELLRRRGTQL